MDYTIQALFGIKVIKLFICGKDHEINESQPCVVSISAIHEQPWDSAVDAALLQLKQFVIRKNQWQYQQLLKKQKVIQKDIEPKLIWKDSSFFAQQLRAFEVWIETGEIQKKPYHLPID